MHSTAGQQQQQAVLRCGGLRMCSSASGAARRAPCTASPVLPLAVVTLLPSIARPSRQRDSTRRLDRSCVLQGGMGGLLSSLVSTCALRSDSVGDALQNAGGQAPVGGRHHAVTVAPPPRAGGSAVAVRRAPPNLAAGCTQTAARHVGAGHRHTRSTLHARRPSLGRQGARTSMYMYTNNNTHRSNKRVACSSNGAAAAAGASQTHALLVLGFAQKPLCLRSACSKTVSCPAA